MNKGEPLSADSPPPCASTQQVTIWLKAAKEARNYGNGMYTFCHDCTPEYQSQMIRQYRCCNPGHLFGVEGEPHE